MTRLLPFTFLLFTFLSSPAWAINLRWECTSNNEDGFTIEKKDGGTADWSLLGKVAANPTTYIWISRRCSGDGAIASRRLTRPARARRRTRRASSGSPSSPKNLIVEP